MLKRLEYTQKLSKGLHGSKNAAIGLGEVYRDMSASGSVDQGLLEEVYNELVELYVQSEVMLMKAYIHRKGHPSIDQSTMDTLTNDLNSIFSLSKNKQVGNLSKQEISSLLNGKMVFLNYEDFEYIDALNRKIDPNDEALFEVIEAELKASPRRERLRKLFIDK